MRRGRFTPPKTNTGPLGGFSLLEVLLAMLLLSVPVAAVQTLMLRSVNHGRWVAQQQLALQAGEAAMNRIFAFHSLGLWPQNLTASGHWMPSLAGSISASDTAMATSSCINRWCSSDQWVAFEHTILACALDHRAAPSTCDELLGLSGESSSESLLPGEMPRSLRVPRLLGFQATLTVDGSLRLVISWPSDGVLAAADGTTPAPGTDLYEVSLGAVP